MILDSSNRGVPDVIATDSASLVGCCPKRIPYTWGHPCWESQCVSCLDIRRDFVASVIINNTNSDFSCLLISTSSSSISGWVWLYQDFISAVRLRQATVAAKAGTLCLQADSAKSQDSRRVHCDSPRAQRPRGGRPSWCKHQDGYIVTPLLESIGCEFLLYLPLLVGEVWELI